MLQQQHVFSALVRVFSGTTSCFFFRMFTFEYDVHVCSVFNRFFASDDVMTRHEMSKVCWPYEMSISKQQFMWLIISWKMNVISGGKREVCRVNGECHNTWSFFRTKTTVNGSFHFLQKSRYGEYQKLKLEFKL